jgi:hypothetical protein
LCAKPGPGRAISIGLCGLQSERRFDGGGGGGGGVDLFLSVLRDIAKLVINCDCAAVFAISKTDGWRHVNVGIQTRGKHGKNRGGHGRGGGGHRDEKIWHMDNL